MRKFGIPAAAAAAALAVLAAAGPVQPSFKLGVVNLKTCFEKDKYERIKDVDADLQRMADDYAKRLKEIEKKMLELRDQVEALSRDSALRAQKLLDLRRLETDLKFEKEYGRAKYLDYYSDRKMEIYNDIRRVISMIGQEQKFDLILRVEQPLLEEQDPETVSQRINNRVVLFHHDSVDITPLVLKRLNDEWAKQKAAQPSVPGGEWECKFCGQKNRGETCTKTLGCKGTRPK
ncbi:MAG: OmpH family outer membrane protein [Planctomycetota bacterium]